MRIAKAIADNLDDLVELNRTVQELHVAHEPGIFRPFDASDVRDTLQKLLDDPAATILLASADGKSLGYAQFRVTERKGNAYAFPRTFIEVDQLAVAPDARRQGIGSALIDETFAIAKSLGIATVELSTWSFNEPAKRLFCKKGFDPTWQRMRTRLKQNSEPDSQEVNVTSPALRKDAP